jgi:hypothetical protein
MFTHRKYVTESLHLTDLLNAALAGHRNEHGHIVDICCNIGRQGAANLLRAPFFNNIHPVRFHYSLTNRIDKCEPVRQTLVAQQFFNAKILLMTLVRSDNCRPMEYLGRV